MMNNTNNGIVTVRRNRVRELKNEIARLERLKIDGVWNECRRDLLVEYRVEMTELGWFEVPNNAGDGYMWVTVPPSD